MLRLSPDVVLTPTSLADGESLADLRVVAMRESLERIGRFDAVRARERFLSGFVPEFTRHIEVRGERAGFVVVRPNDGGLLLDHLYLHPRVQGEGAGSLVVRRVLEEADARGLSVTVGALRESPSNRFYRRHGFAQVGAEEFDNLYARAPGAGDVELLPHDPKWPGLFEREAERVRSRLVDAAIEHVGSTSVPGMPAKPFIDMLAIVADADRLREAVRGLPQIGYHYIPEAERVVAERRFFRRIDASPGYHLHCVTGSAALGPNLLSFRDSLRSDPQLARDYLELKSNLARRHSQDVDAYTGAKGPFIEGVLVSRGRVEP